MDRLIDWLFTVLRSRIFNLYGDVTIAGEGLQNLGLCREGSLSCHTCCDMGPQFFRSHQKDRPIQSPLTIHEVMWRIYSNQDPHGDNGSKPNSNLICILVWQSNVPIIKWISVSREKQEAQGPYWSPEYRATKNELIYAVRFVCLFVYSHTSIFSAIWWLSPLPVTGLQI
jgi:hypothetical protein